MPTLALPSPFSSRSVAIYASWKNARASAVPDLIDVHALDDKSPHEILLQNLNLSRARIISCFLFVISFSLSR